MFHTRLRKEANVANEEVSRARGARADGDHRDAAAGPRAVRGRHPRRASRAGEFEDVHVKIAAMAILNMGHAHRRVVPPGRPAAPPSRWRNSTRTWPCAWSGAAMSFPFESLGPVARPPRRAHPGPRGPGVRAAADHVPRARGALRAVRRRARHLGDRPGRPRGGAARQRAGVRGGALRRARGWGRSWCRCRRGWPRRSWSSWPPTAGRRCSSTGRPTPRRWPRSARGPT